MPDFNSINRLMGTQREMMRQPVQDPLEALMRRADPYWEDRQDTEMDIWEGNAPITVVMTEDGPEERVTTTCRSPADGDRDIAQNGKTIQTELIRHD